MIRHHRPARPVVDLIDSLLCRRCTWPTASCTCHQDPQLLRQRRAADNRANDLRRRASADRHRRGLR